MTQRPWLLVLPSMMALGLLLGARASGRAPAPQTRPTFTIGVDAVALDVVVTDPNGRFVSGLAQDDFLILEEGVPQTLAFFTAEVTPVTVLVLLDSSASVRSHLVDVQSAASRFISRLPRGDAARIGFFHDEVVFGPRFTSSVREHVAMINRMQPQRSTHLYDALLASLEQLSTRHDRTALLLFTDGDDEGSAASMEQAVEAVRRSRATIYAVGVIGWSAAGGMDINAGLLARITADTGGRAFFPAGEKEMRRAFERLSDELHRQYRMTYVPPQVGRQPGCRNIEVRMTKRKNLVVRARTGYFSGTDASEQPAK
jgi:Ca-activated chloride channel homolog